MRFRFAAIFVLLAAVAPVSARAQYPDLYIGEIIYLAGTYCPTGTFPTDGRLLPIAQYQVLFAQLGNRYGGDGRKTFALPKLPPITPGNAGSGVELQSCIVLQGIWPQRD